MFHTLRLNDVDKNGEVQGYSSRGGFEDVGVKTSATATTLVGPKLCLCLIHIQLVLALPAHK